MQNQIPNNWRAAKLGDVIQTLKGFAFKSKWYGNKGDLLIKVTSFTNDSIDVDNSDYLDLSKIKQSFEKYRLETNDILIQTVGSWPSNPLSVVGKVVRVPETARGSLLNQNIVKIIPDNIDKNFIYYLLKSNDFKDFIINRANGAASQASITLEDIKDFKFIFPNKVEQVKITNLLSTLDYKIKVNNKISKTLEEMAQVLFKECFVEPKHNNWEIKNLFEIAEVTYGFPFKSELFNDLKNGTPVIRIRNLDRSLTTTYTTEDVEEKYKVKNGDILIGMDGEFYVRKWSGGEAYINQRVVRLRPKESISWFHLFLSIIKPIRDFQNSVVGTTVAHLSDKDLRSIELTMPPKNIYEKLKLELDNWYWLSVKLHEENQKLAALRDLLLPKLMKGEIRI